MLMNTTFLSCFSWESVQKILGLNVTQVVCALLVLLLAGGLGGLSGALFRKYIRGEKNCLKSKREAGAHVLTGFASAIAFSIVYQSVRCAFVTTETVVQEVMFFGLAFLSGFFSLRLIDIIGAVMAEKMSSILKNQEKLAADVESGQNRLQTEISENQKKIQYLQALLYAANAINNKDTFEMQNALTKIEDMQGIFPQDRHLTINQGRLMRRLGNLSGAIDVLQNFIHHFTIDKDVNNMSDSEKEAVAVSYFNIACYLCLQAVGESNPEPRLQEACQALRDSVKYVPAFRDNWKKDEDLKLLVEKHPELSL